MLAEYPASMSLVNVEGQASTTFCPYQVLRDQVFWAAICFRKSLISTKSYET